MPAFKNPTFQDRTAAAAKAKQKALDQLKAKPPVDEAVTAERRRAREAREHALAEKQAVKIAACRSGKGRESGRQGRRA